MNYRKKDTGEVISLSDFLHLPKETRELFEQVADEPTHNYFDESGLDDDGIPILTAFGDLAAAALTGYLFDPSGPDMSGFEGGDNASPSTFEGFGGGDGGGSGAGSDY